ncbi:hypothetical protein [Phenylobacterium aquaticum]|uniref:hypothetical protein n=1 Tax=Phenylobacterium aquaticum TaxID=1763816 RepID=UPI0026EC0333|nr:hypothetical protein [Phenylobacterium aquaticum]
MTARSAPTQLNLNGLETDVLQLLIEAHPDQADLLRAQLGQSTVTSRRWTGAGFFLNFRVQAAERFEPPRFELNDVYAEIDGLDNGAGFVLFIRDGKIDFLEGHSFGEDWPRTDGGHRAFIKSPVRGVLH